MLSRFHLSSLLSMKVVATSLVGVLLVIAIVGLNSGLRESFQQWYRGNDRRILATIQDDLSGNGQLYSVFKIKEGGRLFLEFYAPRSDESSTEPNGPMELVQTLDLANSIDGYVTFMGTATNLAVANLDGTPNLEILVPSFNLDFSASLDVVRFNPATKQFEFMNAFNFPKDLIEGIQKESK